MRGDIGTARLVTNVHGVSAFQEWIRECPQVESNHSSIVDVAAVTKSPSVCLGCFTVKHNVYPNSSVSTEKFSLPDDKAFILDRIGCLAPYDGVSSANFSGETFPYPGLCQLRVWTTNLYAVTGCCEELIPTHPNSFGSIYFYQKQVIVSDCVIIQGSFSVLSVCFLGWPVDVASDVRWMAGKRLHRSRLSHCLGRQPFSRFTLDNCPQDATLIENSLCSSLVKSSQPHEVSHNIPESSKDSVLPKVSEYFELLGNSRFHKLLEEEIPDESRSKEKSSSFLPLPVLSSLQRIAVMAPDYLRELHVVLSHVKNGIPVNSNDINSSLRYSILQSSCFRRLFSLLFWPLEINGTYSRYFGVIQCPECLLMDPKVMPKESISPPLFLPFDIFNATLKQKRLCLQLLSCLLRLSPIVADLLCFFGGHAALFHLADIDEEFKFNPDLWHYPIYPLVDGTEKGIPCLTWSLKTLALECLASLSCHHLGLFVLSYPSTPFSVLPQSASRYHHDLNSPPSLYTRLVKYALMRLSFSQSSRRKMVANIFNNMLLFDAIQGFQFTVQTLCTQESLQYVTRQYVIGVIEALYLLRASIQHIQQKKELMGLSSHISSCVDPLTFSTESVEAMSSGKWDETVEHFLAIANSSAFCAALLKLQKILNRFSAGFSFLPVDNEAIDDQGDNSKFLHHYQYLHERLVFFLKGNVFFEKIKVLSFPLLIKTASKLNSGLMQLICATSTGVSALLSQCVCSVCKESSLSTVSNKSDLVSHEVCLLDTLPKGLRERIGKYKMASQLVVDYMIPKKTYLTYKSLRDISRFSVYCFPSLIDFFLASDEGISDCSFVLPLQPLFRLLMFLKNPLHVDIFLRIWGKSVTLCASLGQSLHHIVSRQRLLEQEQKKQAEPSADSTLSKCISVSETKSDLASLVTITYLVNIIWILFMHSHHSDTLQLLTYYCHTAITLLCTTGCSSLVDCCEVVDLFLHSLSTRITCQAPSSHESNEKASIVCKLLHRLQNTSNASSTWGSVDTSFQAYRNFDDSTNETEQDVSMLNYLVPASLFTTLEQVFDCDVCFVRQCYDLLKGMQLVEGYSSFHPLAKIQKKNQSYSDAEVRPNVSQPENIPGVFNPSKTIFSDFSTSENKSAELSSNMISSTPYHGLKYLLAQFISLSISLHPTHLVPLTEMPHLGQTGTSTLSRYTTTSTPKTPASLTAIRLGGYNGTIGVPVLEPQYVVSKDVKLDPAATQAKRHLAYYTLKSELYTTLKLLVAILQTHTPEAAHDTLLMSLHGGEERLTVIHATSLEAPHLLIQNDIMDICSALLRVLNFFSASICPSLFLGHSGEFNFLITGEDALRAFTITVDMLPLIEITLQFLYKVLDLMLTTINGSTRCACHQTLFDSNVQSTLIFLTSRLLQFIVLASTSNSLPNPRISGSTTEEDEEQKNHPSCDQHLGQSLNVLCSIIKLLCLRCPDSAASFLEVVLRQSRIFPTNYALAPFIISCLNGLDLLFPEPEGVMKWSEQYAPLVAAELNGAEGRNLDAVVARLKQMYIQRRNMENTQINVSAEANIGSSATSRLPTSMTTLCLSTPVNIPEDIQKRLKISQRPLYLQLKISLAPPVLSPQTSMEERSCADEKLVSPLYNKTIQQRRLGRLSMGNDGDFLSFSVFDPASQLPTSKHQLNTSSMDQAALPAAASAEWTAWDRVWDLLNNSLSEEVIDVTLEPDCTPAVPFGFSANTINEVTTSTSLVKEMFKRLNTDQANDEKAHIERLHKISRAYQQVTIENIGELVQLLLVSSHTSNHLLHVTTARCLALITWNHGPPVLDFVMYYVKCLTTDLYESLANEFRNQNFQAVSQVFLISRLILLIDHVFGFIPLPTIEATTCLVELASVGLRALQQVPDLEPGNPRTLVVTGLFDGLLPSFVRLLHQGVKTFESFLFRYTKNFELNSTRNESHEETYSQETALESHKVVTQHEYLEKKLTNKFNVFFSNCPIFKASQGDIFKSTAQMSIPTTNTTPASLNKERSTELEFPGINTLQSSLRSCCSGLSFIINQLPTSWETLLRRISSLDVLSSLTTDWSGLSLYVVKEVLTVLDSITQSRLLCYVSLYDLPEPFIHQFLMAWRSTDFPDSIHDFCVSGNMNPTIRLEGFLINLIDFLSGSYQEIKTQLKSERADIVIDIVEITIRIFSNTLINTHKTSLSFALSLYPVQGEIEDSETLTSTSSAKTIPSASDSPSVTSPAELSGEGKNTIEPACLSSVYRGLKTFVEECTKDITSCGVDESHLSRLSTILKTIEQLKDFITVNTTLSSPPLVKGSQLISDFGKNIYSYPSIVQLSHHGLSQRELLRYCPFTASLLFNYYEPSPSLSIYSLALSMNDDPIWLLAAVLDKVTVQYNLENDHSPLEPKREMSSFLCLSSIMWSQAAQQDIAPSGILSTTLHETLQLTRRQCSYPLGRSGATTGVSTTDVTLMDSFRARKGPSSRAPSKHVDEFEAQQAKLYSMNTTKNDTSSTNEALLEPSLQAIPEWREFVASGKSHGLDVMRILKSPELLQDPALESRFRFLVDLHPSIKTLFTMMESEIIST